MTNHWIDIRNSDVILVMGSNAAENHPISFKWVMEAKDKGATLLSVDPRADCDNLRKWRSFSPVVQLADLSAPTHGL